MISCFEFAEDLEKKVRELYATVCKLEEEKYDWEDKIRKQDFEVIIWNNYLNIVYNIKIHLCAVIDWNICNCMFPFENCIFTVDLLSWLNNNKAPLVQGVAHCPGTVLFCFKSSR